MLTRFTKRNEYTYSTGQARDIVFRPLPGEQGFRLRHVPSPDGYTQRIAQALETLRQNFDQTLSIESLVKDLGMSSTHFHHHFKAVTDMSPLHSKSKSGFKKPDV